MTSTRFYICLWLLGLFACGDDSVAPIQSDCRDRSAECAQGFECVRGNDGLYDCVASATTDAYLDPADGNVDAWVGDAASTLDAAVSADAATSNEMDGGGSGTVDDAMTEMPDAESPEPCSVNPCENGGRCSAVDGGYTCQCAPGFEGANCDVNVDECAGRPCLNGGDCVDGVNQYTCQCTPGFEGLNCDVNIDECAGSPCLNGGDCVDGVNQYACQCAPGFDGANCETDINECDRPEWNDCDLNADCLDAPTPNTAPQCVCKFGFEGDGRSCIDIAECQLNNGGCDVFANCVESLTPGEPPTCECDIGFEGNGQECDPICGDGLLVQGEACDDGDFTVDTCPYGEMSCTVCSATCQFVYGATSYCGDDRIEPEFEDCDSALTDAEFCQYGLERCELCSLGCTTYEGLPQYCGDFVVDDTFGEVCDDGNRIANDGCTNTCVYARPMACPTICGPGALKGIGYEVHRQLEDPSPRANGSFGTVVDISGRLAAVGSRSSFNGPNGEAQWGDVTVFTRGGNTQWTVTTVLTYPGAREEGFPGDFGSVLALDGTTLAVGEPYPDIQDGNGMVYVFEPDSQGVWQSSELPNPDAQANGTTLMTLYGSSVAVSGDWVAVGATATVVNPHGTDDLYGAVYLFQKSDGNWVFRQKLMAPVNAYNDDFGWSIALDGPRLLVGAPGSFDPADEFNTYFAGAAYLYERNAQNQWVLAKSFTAPVVEPEAMFGEAVALNGDHILITAPYGLNTVGRVWASTHWNGMWTAFSELEVPQEQFNFVSSDYGMSLAIENGLAVIGSPGRPLQLDGVFLFEWTNGVWRFVESVVPYEETWREYMSFGFDVALSDGVIIVGAETDDVRGDQTYYGSAFIVTHEPAMCLTSGACLCEPGVDQCEAPE